MDISNSVINAPLSPERVKPNVGVKTNEQVQRNEQRTPNEDNSRQNGRNPQARLAAPSELEQRSSEIQFNKLQRVNSLEQAPLRNQQAVNTYQQTVDAGREYLEGELVGIDLFV